MGAAAPFIKVGIAVAAVGAQIVMAATAKTEGPRLGDLSVSAATYGLGIPHGWGVARLGGNMIWSSGIKEKKGSHKNPKGKGSTTTYTYYASFAFAFAAGPAERILRMWADSKIFYDELAGVYSVPNVAIRQYYGTEDQLPDAAIEADKGVGQVPGFRGLVYVVFENVPLAPFGNRIPSISAEVAFGGQSLNTLTWETAAIPNEDNPYTSDTFVQQLFTGWAIDWQRNKLYTVAEGSAASDGSALNGVAVTDIPSMQKNQLFTIDQLYEGTGFTAPPAPSTGDFTGQLITLDCGNGLDLFLIMTDDTSLPTRCRCIRVNQDTMRVTGECEVFSVGVLGSVFGISGCCQRTYDLYGNLIPWVAYNGGNRVFMVDGYNMVYKGTVLTGNFSDTNFTHLLPGAQNDDGSGDFWFIQTSINDGPTHNYVDLWKISIDINQVVSTTLVNTINGGLIAIGATYVCVQRADYDRANQALLLWVSYGATQVDAEFPTSANTTLVSLNPNTGLANWSIQNAGGGSDDKGYSLIDGSKFGWVDGASHIQMVDTRTGTSIVNTSLTGASDSFFGSVFSSRLQASVSFEIGVAFQLIKYDNGQGAPAILGDIVRDICVETGLTADDVDVTDLTQTVRGYTHTQEAARQLITDLASAYFFDGAETEYVLKFVNRGKAPVLTIPYADLVPPGDGAAALPVVRNQAESIPRRVWVRYPDTDHDQQQGTQFYARSQKPDSVSVVNSAGEQTLDTRIVYNASEAKTVAQKRLMMLWAERSTLQFGLKPFYMSLDPMDVILVTTRDTSTSRLRVERTALGADLAVQISGTIEDQTLNDLSVTGDGGSGLTNPAQVPTSYTPVVVQPEMPLIRDTDDTHQLSLRQYGAMGAYSGQNFGGASLLTSADNASWDALFSSQTSMSWGVAINALPAPAALWTTDNINHLDVTMVYGGSNLETVTSDQILQNANPAILTNAAGQVELLQFQTVTPLSSTVYRLTGLIRGRRGTEWACGLHGAGDRFVLLDTNAWGANTVPLSWLGLVRYDKTLGPWDSIDTVPTIQRVYAGTAEKPYAPTYIQGAWAAGDLTISWQRRDRITAEWRDLTEDIPLHEASESYSIDILDGGGAVVRTLTSATNSVVYSAVDQATDGLSSPISVAVYQISALVGRGYPGYATLTDPGTPPAVDHGAVIIAAASATDSWSATGGHTTSTIVEAASASATVSATGGIILASTTANTSATDTITASVPSTGGTAPSVPMQAKGLYYLASPPDVAAVAAQAARYDIKVIEPSTDDGIGNTFVTVSNVNAMRGTGGPVLCYMDIGANEPGRYWFNSIRSAGVSGLTPDEWGEYPIRFWDPLWYTTVQGYIDKAMAAGFDGMYWDVVDNWQSSYVGGATSTNAQHMIQFMYDMRHYAAVTKGRPDFLFWANGGEELMDYGSFPTIGSYIDNMDGFYKEEVLYSYSGSSVHANSSGDRTTEHDYFAQAVTAGKPVVLIEYVGNGTGTGTTCPGSEGNTVTITGGVAAAIADVQATTASWNMGYFVAHANYPTPPLDFVDTEGL